MALSNASLLVRIIRRLGRFGIALLSLAAFGIAFGVVYLATALTMGIWFPKLCGLAGLGGAFGVYTLLDRLDLIPEDPDKLITLSLTDPPPDAKPGAWISSDGDQH